MWMDLATRKRINIVRAKQLMDTKADVVAVSCPHCLTMLEDARSVMGDAAASLHLQDIAEIVAQALPEPAERVLA
jgi:Fe-S oxidoreductase